MLRLSKLAQGVQVYGLAFFKKAAEESQAKKEKSGLKSLFEQIKFKQVDVKSIDDVNKYFLGIRMNTKYAKFYNEDSIKNVYNFSGRKIADLPFRHDSQEDKVEVIGRTSKVCASILEKVDRKKLEEKLLQMSSDYFTDLLEDKRTVKIEPNFEREARRVIASLKKDGYAFEMKKNEESQVKILSCQLYKGLEVTRNNNYAIDSYQIIKTKNYTFYKLWQKGSYKIPEEEWSTQSNLLMRITAKIRSPYSISITKSKESSINLNSREHTFVFEMDLKKPPRFSQFRLDPIEHMKKYEPVLSNLTITNVDQRNPYAAFAFEQKQKKESLINKLV